MALASHLSGHSEHRPSLYQWAPTSRCYATASIWCHSIHASSAAPDEQSTPPCLPSAQPIWLLLHQASLQCHPLTTQTIRSHSVQPPASPPSCCISPLLPGSCGRWGIKHLAPGALGPSIALHQVPHSPARPGSGCMSPSPPTPWVSGGKDARLGSSLCRPTLPKLPILTSVLRDSSGCRIPACSPDECVKQHQRTQRAGRHLKHACKGTRGHATCQAVVQIPSRGCSTPACSSR